MKKFLIFVILIVVIAVVALIFDQKIFMDQENSQQENLRIREPAVAGAFYPETEDQINTMIDKFILEANLPKLKGIAMGLVVPHAGYQFSGQVAAYGYKALKNSNIDTVVLIGNSHKEQFEGASVYASGYYKTPLGKVKINQDKAQKIIDSSDKIYFKQSVHQDEHSLEVQLPFLQKVLKNNFEIIPIIIGSQTQVVEDLVEALSKTIDKNTLVIASSDLSHYPNYEDAKYSDNKVIEAILTGNRNNLQNTISNLEKENISNLQTCACAQESIEVLMGLMEGKQAILLKYANSGDTSGNKNQVVGYGTIAFLKENKTNKQEAMEDELKIDFTNSEKEKLLEVAKNAVNNYVTSGEIIEPSNKFLKLDEHLGAFVTLKKHGQLRGCIGRFEPEKPLYQVVKDMAIAACSQDARFSPVSEEELDELEYEISVLSKLKKVDSWREVEIGKHGVKIVQDLRSGVFLPQVASDNNWDRETFLSILCQQKAGLPADCYKDQNTDIYIFTAEVFSDKEVLSKSLLD